MPPLFFFTLLFFPQSSTSTWPNSTASCRPGTIAECRTALFVPGHTLLGEGVNIVTMKPTGSFPLDMQAVDKKCTLCRNPHNGDVLQKLPNAMAGWRPQPPCTRNIASSLYLSNVSLAKEATAAVKNDWKFQLDVERDLDYTTQEAVGGSQSDMVKFVASKSVSDKYSFLSHRLQCSYYSFGLSAEPALTSHFAQSLSQLPAAYDGKTKAEYRRVISRYGTHYITQAEVGGWTQEVTAVRTCNVAISGVTLDEVKDCLHAEAEINAKGGKASPATQEKVKLCAKKAKQDGSFHQMFNERWWQAQGGNITFDLLSGKKGSQVVEKWLKSVRTHPGLVSYSLQPLHNLVRSEGPQKENLRLAISDYIKEKALIMNCTCSGPAYLSHRGDCSCLCPATNHTNSDCCPTKRGEAKLQVTVKEARGLYGDITTQTDAYVKIKFGSAEAIAPTIWNNDNPKWNKTFDLNIVELATNKKITVEVWDEDNKYDDDLLGRCEEPLTPGDVSRICYLNHGSLTYSLSVQCLPHLQGPNCRDYSPSPP